jgi:membrane protease YdiL (CAAX protease family)
VARWAAFLGLTGVVLSLFLGLARLSQGAVRDPAADSSPSDEGPDGPGDTSADSPSGSGTGPVDPEPGPGSEFDPAPDSAVGSEGHVPSGLPEDTGPSDPREDSDPWDDPPGLDSGAPSLSAGALLANVAVTQGLFGGVLAVGAFYFEIPPSALGLGGEDLALLAAGVGLGVVLWAGNALAAALADAVGAGYDETLREMLSPDSATGWVVLFGVVLPVVALVEEFVFRAAVIGVPAAGFGTPVWALVPVSAGAFALGHGAQGRVGVAVTGGLGLVLAGAYAVTGSLLVVVVAHYLVNALEFAVHELFDRPRLWASR